MIDAAPGTPLPMKRVLLVADPVGGATSVQFELLCSLVHGLESRYKLSAYTPCCDPTRIRALHDAGCEVITPRPDGFALNRILQLRRNVNESMLWAESWTREALFQKNSKEAAESLIPGRFDYVVNLSMTVPVKSDLWWVLGTPLDQTLEGMAGANPIARLANALGHRAVTRLDGRVLNRILSQTMRVVANSPYLRELYRERGVPVEGVVYTLKDMTEFQPTLQPAQRDYVLLYIGKETDHLDFRALVDSGVRVVGFGSKVPAGTRLKRFTDSIEWLGRVSQKKLVELYANALFTLFPFTCEPMGLVPIESMACGTPVLTYGRQGPASTVLPNATGWLVDTPEQMVAKATEIWHRGTTGISKEACILRARQFSGIRMVDELVDWIEGACPVDQVVERITVPSWSSTGVGVPALGHA
jgi:glycosyltransferase involved in cell wall biosynthesis